MIRRISALSALIGAVSCSSDSEGGLEPVRSVVESRADASDEFYFYQGQRIELDRDSTRLIVISPDEQSVSGALRDADARAGAISRLDAEPNHWLVRVDSRVLDGGIDSTVARLKRDPRVRRTLPAFRTREGRHDYLMTDRVLVEFSEDVASESADSLIRAFGATIVRRPRRDSGVSYFVLRYPVDSASPLRVAAQLDRHPMVSWADPVVHTVGGSTSAPPDPFYSMQYWLKNATTLNSIPVDINVEDVWQLTTGAWAPSTGGLRVGVLGVGVDASHPEFDTRVMSGYDAVVCNPACGSETSPYLNDAHETAVAGIIAARHDAVGVAGIAPGVYIVPARIAKNGVFVNTQGIADAINYLWSAGGVHVISASWFMANPSNAVTNAISAANTSGRGGLGTVVVFSTGNNSNRLGGFVGNVTYPGSLSTVVGVSAINSVGAITNYSPEGSTIDIVAISSHQTTSVCSPGVGDMVTTDLVSGSGCNGGPSGNQDFMSTFSGTSAAAPQVAAVAALIISREPMLSATAVKARLYSGADPWGATTRFGAGKLNALRSVTNVVVSISGVSSVFTPGVRTWTASATGGNGSYVYAWEERSLSRA